MPLLTVPQRCVAYYSRCRQDQRECCRIRLRRVPPVLRSVGRGVAGGRSPGKLRLSLLGSNMASRNATATRFGKSRRGERVEGIIAASRRCVRELEGS
jgi:hypothetical protein